ncbi:MAG: hypothetical protein U0W40_02485 [Acidimicrobiia bacterium]
MIDRTDLPDAPAISCGPATAPVLVSETSTTDAVLSVIVTVGPATVFVGEDQTVEYHVPAGETNFTALTTTTVTLHQTWQGHAAGAPCPTQGQQGFTSTTASKRVVVTNRTDLPNLPAAACDALAVAPRLIDETATTGAPVTEAIVTVGPQTIFIGPEQSVQYQVVSGEIDTTTLVTTTTTIQQTWQGRAAGAPCSGVPVAQPSPPTTVAAAVAVPAAPAFTG